MSYKFKFDPVKLSKETSDAYSADGFTSWTACARLLAERGFNNWEAEAILRSKITRWACDMWTKKTKPTSGALANYLDTYGIKPGCKEVNELVISTFSKEYRLELNSEGIPCKRGNMPGNPKGGTVLVPLGTPLINDPTSETYWAM